MSAKQFSNDNVMEMLEDSDYSEDQSDPGSTFISSTWLIKLLYTSIHW